MSFFSNRNLFILSLSIILPVFLLFTSYSFIKVEKYNQKISKLHSVNEDQTISSLPFGKIQATPSTDTIVSGEFLLQKQSMAAIKEYILLPFYTGNLQLYLNGVEFFDGAKSGQAFNATAFNHLYLELPEVDYSRDNIIKIELSYQNMIFAALSEIYIGDKKDFEPIDRGLIFYYDDLRVMFWGAHLLFSITLFVLWITKALDDEAIPPFIIGIFMLVLTNQVYAKIFPGSEALQPFFFAFAPVCLVGISEFRRYLTTSEKFYFSRSYLIASLILYLIEILTYHITNISMQSINTFITVPYLFLGILYIFALTVQDFIRSKNVYSGFLAAALSTFALAIPHDITARLGYHNNLITISGLGIPLLFFAVGAVFAGKIARDQKALARSNIILVEKIKENTQTLQDDFAKISELNAKHILAKEASALHSELHDGVLTYLSMINAMTEQSTDEKFRSINTLARNASTEIRVIVDAESIQRMSLFAALSTFRQRVADPLVFLNVDVDWDLRPLQHYHTTNPNIIMGVVRIFQEALHNAVERGKCTGINVRAEWLANETMKVTILNSGGNSLRPSDKPGMGIKSMRRRAREIGAEFSLEPVRSGAILELILPRGNGFTPYLKKAN